MKIEIENLTKAQELAIKSMLATWQCLSGVGASRWVAFYADGDGNFRPKILVDGLIPKEYKNKKGEYMFTEKEDMYKIDFDAIAWDLKGDEQ